jgi:hypothetical protein
MLTENERRVVLDLINASNRMRAAANDLWWAHNPDEDVVQDRSPPSLDDAQEAHSDAFAALQTAEHYARRLLERSADQPEPQSPVQP